MPRASVSAATAPATMGAYAAFAPQQKVKPAFVVQKLEGVVKRFIHMFDKSQNKILKKEIEEDAGYLVTFAKGHSIRCRDEAHLKEIGAGLDLVPIINNDGQVVGSIPNSSITRSMMVDEEEDK